MSTVNTVLDEINDVLLDFVQVNRTAHVLNATEYWALEPIAQIINRNRNIGSAVSVKEYDYTD